jgi:hypothetical protein
MVDKLQFIGGMRGMRASGGKPFVKTYVNRERFTAASLLRKRRA